MPKDPVEVLGNGVLRTEIEGMICRLVYVLHDSEMTEAIRQTVQGIIKRRRCKGSSMTTEINPGDIVRLKSGGPWMTVGMSVEHDGKEGTHVFHCWWTGEGDAPLNGHFPDAALLPQNGDDALPGPHFKEYAERAYKAYGDKADWKNFRGDPMPEWGDLPENIRTYWQAAAVQVITDCNGKYNSEA